MNRKRETGMAWLTVAIIAVICLLVSLCSCSTKKTITETIYVHDTVQVHKTDTVVDVVIKTEGDTVREKEVHTYTLNNVGDTVKEIHHYHETEKVKVVDSTYRYRAERDSLKQALVAEKNKKEKVVKQRPTIVDYAIVVAILAAVIVLVLRSKRLT